MVGVIARFSNGNLATLEKGKECIVNINNSKIYSDRFTLGVATSNNKIINYCVVKKDLKTDNYITWHGCECIMI